MSTEPLLIIATVIVAVPAAFVKGRASGALQFAVGGVASLVTVSVAFAELSVCIDAPLQLLPSARKNMPDNEVGAPVMVNVEVLALVAVAPE